MKSYNVRDSYKLYKAERENPVDIKVYVSIISGFVKFLTRKLFQRGEITLPERMGTINIVGKKSRITIEEGQIKGLAPDWKSTNELWERDEEAKARKQLVFHFNEETNGIRYRFFWSKNRMMVSNKTLYRLVMTRTNKRDLAKLIKEGKEYQILR